MTTCTLTDDKQSYKWLYNPAVVQTSIQSTVQQYQALKGDNQYIYFLGRSESLTLPLSIPGVNSDLNPTLNLLRRWVRENTRLSLSYGSVQYPVLYLKSITEAVIQYRNGFPVSADVTLEFIVGSTNKKTPVSINTEVKTDREIQKLKDALKKQG